jgi:hypothetical protein
MKSYYLSMIGGALCVLGAYSGAVLLAENRFLGRLPPPAISGVVPTDEKFRYLRDRTAEQPVVLAVGSSLTWMHLDGAPIEREVGAFLNGGTAYLKVNQIHSMTRFYLDLFPEVSTVVMMTGIADFDSCHRTPDEIMDAEQAKSYVTKSRPTPYYYIRNFAPLRYALQMRTRHRTQQPYGTRGTYWHDAYGTTPIVEDGIGMEYDLRYVEIGVDPACLDALEVMATDLRARGISLEVMLAPVNPRYAAEYPHSEDSIAAVAAFARSVDVSLHDLHDDPRFAVADFWDAFHLQWPAAQRLSEIVAARLRDRPTESASLLP